MLSDSGMRETRPCNASVMLTRAVGVCGVAATGVLLPVRAGPVIALDTLRGLGHRNLN